MTQPTTRRIPGGRPAETQRMFLSALPADGSPSRIASDPFDIKIVDSVVARGWAAREVDGDGHAEYRITPEGLWAIGRETEAAALRDVELRNPTTPAVPPACTYGGDCPVHPDVQQVHNFDQPPATPALPLPPLDKPCPHCTTPEAQQQIAADREAWVEDEQAAYMRFVAEYPYEWGAADAWKESAAYRELYNREPDPMGVGCVECDYGKVVLTDAGRQVLEFMRRWSK